MKPFPTILFGADFSEGSREAFRAACSLADLKYPVEARLARGDAAEEILRAGAELDCGLIVMGTHGRTGLSRLFMGSVTECVMPQADCPVLAVKTPRGAEAPAPEQASEPVAASH